jgi:hypothetical protein
MFFGDGWGSAPGYGLSWLTSIETTTPVGSDDNWIAATAFAPNGDLLACGSLSGNSVVFGPGTDNEIAFDSGLRGIFLARFEADGTPLWVSTVRTGWVFVAEGWDLEVMDDGSILMAGRLPFKPSFLPVFGAGEPGEVTLEACSEECPFIAKYDADGGFEWVSSAIAGKFGRFESMAVATNGDICVSGTFFGPIVFDDGTSGGWTIDILGNTGLLARFDAGGGFLWARATGNTGCASSNGVAALPDGSCAALFMHVGNTFVDTGYSEPVEVLAGGYWSLLVANYFENGNLAWVKDLGIVGGLQTPCPREKPDGISAVGGDLLVGSEFNGTLRAGTEHDPVLVEAGETLYDLGFFLARLSGKDGARLWTSTATGTTNPDGQNNFDRLWTVETTNDDRVFVGGGFTGIKFFGPGEPNQTALASTGQSPDAFVAAYETDGSFLWASRVATQPVPSETYLGPDLGAWVTSVSADGSGSLIVAGGFTGMATFGLGPDDCTTLEAIGSPDAFLMRLDPD